MKFRTDVLNSLFVYTVHKLQNKLETFLKQKTILVYKKPPEFRLLQCAKNGDTGHLPSCKRDYFIY